MEKHNYLKLVAKNRKFKYNYSSERFYEAGIVLVGTEVKSLRMGKASLGDSYAKIENGEAFIYQMHIGLYPFAHHDNHVETRTRKLLLKKAEIKKLSNKINQRGYTLIPTKIYFKNGKAKVTLGLAKGKREYDKREVIRKRDQYKDLARELKTKRY